MSRNILMVCCLWAALAASAAAQPSPLTGAHTWKKPGVKGSSVLFEGAAADFNWLQMSANALVGRGAQQQRTVAPGEQQVMIVRSGTMKIAFRDSVWTIGPGSAAMLIPGETWTAQNMGKDSCTYYLVRLRSKHAADPDRGQKAGGSLVRPWSTRIFQPHDRGGVRSFFERPTLYSKRLEMHVSTLNPGIRSHDPHTHAAEEMVLMLAGTTEMQLGSSFYKGGPGTIYYLGSMVPHAIRNIGNAQCMYVAFQFE